MAIDDNQALEHLIMKVGDLRSSLAHRNNNKSYSGDPRFIGNSQSTSAGLSLEMGLENILNTGMKALSAGRSIKHRNTMG